LLKKVEARQNVTTAQLPIDNDAIVFQSTKMKEVFSTVGRLSQYQTTVLITGESGTGKELLAKAIHKNSARADKKFVAINCGAIPEHLIESELFGHKRGSFTDAIRDKRGLFEEANGGTVFLDEVGELPLHLQVKLLRALQEQKIRRVGDEELISLDIRVIAATLKDLESEVKVERFREDLYYRLNVVNIHLPALRERADDIPLLVSHFIKKHNSKLGLKKAGFTSEAMKVLSSYMWRGNIRELENCIERAMVMSDSDEIPVSALPAGLRTVTKSQDFVEAQVHTNDQLSIKQRTRDLEVDLINRALKKTAGNRTHAAKILEISHRALLYKIKEYNLGGKEDELG
jgi:two-component system response regulator AtoC